MRQSYSNTGCAPSRLPLDLGENTSPLGVSQPDEFAMTSQVSRSITLLLLWIRMKAAEQNVLLLVAQKLLERGGLPFMVMRPPRK